jgi:hypothetical protein
MNLDSAVEFLFATVVPERRSWTLCGKDQAGNVVGKVEVTSEHDKALRFLVFRWNDNAFETALFDDAASIEAILKGYVEALLRAPGVSELEEYGRVL